MRSNQILYNEFKAIYELVNRIVTAAIQWCTGCSEIIVQLLHTQCVCSIDKSKDYSHNRYSYYSHRLL